MVEGQKEIFTTTSFEQTEKIESSHQEHSRQHNDAKVTSLGSLLCVPVRLSKGIDEQNNNQTYIHRGTYWYPNWLFECPAWGTEPYRAEQMWYVGIQGEYYSECFKSYET